LAVGALLDDLGQLPPTRATAALGAMLDDPLLLAGKLGGDAAFVDVVAARLLDVDVLLRLAGPDGHQSVPVVGRGDRDGVEAAVLQRLADVLHTLRRVAALLLDRLDGAVPEAGVGIDEVDDARVLAAGQRAGVGL